MNVVLKRIRRTSFDNVKKIVLENFNSTHSIELDGDILEKNSENVLVTGKTITISYSLEKYVEIVNSNMKTYEKLAEIGMLLHSETKDINGTSIPKNIFYEPEVWAYLSFKVFFDVVKSLRLDDDDKITEDKIERFFFNTKNKRSRTGLLFVWSMIDLLDSESNKQVSTVAFHFIDPVKAVYERAMSRNSIVLKAYVEAIINNDCDARIKNKKYKLKIPNNISCFARINILDAYGYEELVNVMTEQIKELLLIA